MITRPTGSNAECETQEFEFPFVPLVTTKQMKNSEIAMVQSTVAPAQDFLSEIGTRQFATILADPPWRFQNRTGKVAPEHRRLSRYGTLSLQQIVELPVPVIAAKKSHLYLWVPNALLKEGLEVMKAWGFEYKTNIIWHKVRKDGGPDGRGVGFYFRNTTELILFGVRGSMRTMQPGRRQVNIIKTQKREHSRKPDELYDVIEACSPGPYLELFARGKRKKWTQWGNQVEDYSPSWPTYSNHSQSKTQHRVTAVGDSGAKIYKLKSKKEKPKAKK